MFDYFVDRWIENVIMLRDVWNDLQKNIGRIMLWRDE